MLFSDSVKFSEQFVGQLASGVGVAVAIKKLVIDALHILTAQRTM